VFRKEMSSAAEAYSFQRILDRKDTGLPATCTDEGQTTLIFGY
jgi:hypothetical protein